MEFIDQIRETILEELPEQPLSRAEAWSQILWETSSQPKSGEELTSKIKKLALMGLIVWKNCEGNGVAKSATENLGVIEHLFDTDPTLLQFATSQSMFEVFELLADQVASVPEDAGEEEISAVAQKVAVACISSLLSDIRITEGRNAMVGQAVEDLLAKYGGSGDCLCE